MREEDSNWFSKWKEELPSPDELMPLSQTLITPDLALAFDIPSNHHHLHRPLNHRHHHHLQQFHSQNHHPISAAPPPPPPPLLPPAQAPPSSGEVDSSSGEMGATGGGGGCGGGGGSGGSGGGGEEPARTLKRPRLVWTPQLHKRFVDAVAHLGIKHAVPKTIMQLMSVDGLTRENVASHLQKYRLYLKRMQGLNGAAGAGAGLSPTTGDPATDHLFASAPVPPHFLHQAVEGGGRADPEHLVPYMPPPQVPALQQQQQQMGPVASQYQNHHHPQMGRFGSSPSGPFEHPLLSRGSHVGPRMNGGSTVHHSSFTGGFSNDVESVTGNGRKVLALFPTVED